MRRKKRCRAHGRRSSGTTRCWTTTTGCCGILWFCLRVRRDWSSSPPPPPSFRQRKVGLLGALGTTSGGNQAISGQTPFPRWNRTPVTAQAVRQALQQALQQATANGTNSRTGHAFHLVHVVDANYRLYSLCVSCGTDTSSPPRQRKFWWGRARSVTNFLLPQALRHFQRHADQFPAIHRHLQQQGLVVLLANYGDSRQCAADLPILSLSAPVHCPTAFPVPNYELVKLALLRQRRQPRRRPSTKPHEWLALQPRVIWRGSPTGRPTIADNARAQLCLQALEFPHLVDAKLVLSHPRYAEWLAREMPNATTTTATTIQQIVGTRSVYTNHRAVLDIDGNSWSSRFASLLCSSQVVLKVQPDDVDYWFPDLQPYQHYVPVHANLSNLRAQAAWAVADENVQAAQRIIQQANAWCAAQLTLPQLATDVAHIWEAYASMVNPTTTTTTATPHHYHGSSTGEDLLGQYPWEEHSIWNRKDARFRVAMEYKARFLWG